MMNLWISVLVISSVHAANPPLPDASARIMGTLQALGPCLKGDARIWISSGKNLVTQMTVPIGGRFDFNVGPGRLNIVAASTSGCYAETGVTLAANETRNLTLELASGGR